MNFYRKKVFKNLYLCTCVHVVCVHVVICAINSEWNDIILILLYIIIILYYVRIIIIIIIIVIVVFMISLNIHTPPHGRALDIL